MSEKVIMLKNSPIHAHIPFLKLDEYIKSIADHKINIELYINANDLDTTPQNKFVELENRLRNEEIDLTIHGPFMDLTPGGVDSKVRRATFERMVQFMDAANLLNPKIIVAHPGFDHWRNDYNEKQWLENSCLFWQEILNYTKDSVFRIAVENVFEQTPDTLEKLIEGVASDRFGFCFDTGHFNLFSKVSLDEWLKKLGPYLFETHLHDNKGDKDSHLPLGEGTFPFSEYFKILENIAASPILIFETHSEEGVLKSISSFWDFIRMNYCAASSPY